MGLTALVHLELELGMGGRELGQKRVERRRLVAREQRQQAARLGEQRSATARATSSKRLAAGDRLALGKAEPGALPHVTPFSCDVSEATVTAFVATAGVPRHRVGVFVGARDESNATSAASPAWSGRSARHAGWTMVGRLLGGHDHVLVVRQQHYLGGAGGLHRRDEIGSRGVHGRAAVDHTAPTLSKSARLPAPR